MGMKHAAVAAGLALGSMSGVADASPLKFSFTGIVAATSLVTIDFDLDSSPTPSFSVSDVGFRIDDVDFTVTQGSQTYPIVSAIDFYTAAFAGGLTLNDPSDDGFLRLAGPVLFSGDVQAPTFTLGSYSLAGIQFDELGNPVDGLTVIGNLTISSVPLPASAPLFGAAVLALGLVGHGMKRRKAAAAA